MRVRPSTIALALVAVAWVVATIALSREAAPGRATGSAPRGFQAPPRVDDDAAPGKEPVGTAGSDLGADLSLASIP